MNARPSSCPAIGEQVIRVGDCLQGVVEQQLNRGEAGPRELACRWQDGSSSIELRAAVIRLSTFRSAA